MSRPGPRARRWAVRAAELALFTAVFLAVHAWQTRDLVPADRATPAPSLALPDLAGRVHDLRDYAGRPTLVYFFAPWCGVCAASAGNLERLARWRRDAVDVVLVALDYASRDDVAAYARRHGLTVPVLLGDAATGRRWRVPGYPTYYVLDGAGHVRRRDFGYSTTAGLLWRTWGLD